jgi:uncharacterized protein (TIGR02996 family)
VARNQELEAEILANPADPATWLVYGDWLTDHGDPRGELVAVQAQRAERRDDPLLAAKELKLMRDHGTAWLGEMAALEDKDFACTWRFGFLDSVRFGPPVDRHAKSKVDFAKLYAQLVTLESATFLRDLTFGSKSSEDWPATWSEEVTAVVEHGVSPALRRLSFDSGGYWDISNTDSGDLPQIYPWLGALEVLDIHMGLIELGKMELPSLRALDIVTGGLTADNLASIRDAAWPKLERLSIYIGSADNDYGCNVQLTDVRELIEKLQAPHLVHLGLANSSLADEIVVPLARSPLLRRLRSIDLSHGTLGDDGARAILEHADAFRHLESINLGMSYIVDEDVLAGLRRLGPKVDVSDQQEPGEDGEDRYVQIAE